ncbi:MAG: hypothetical protein QOF50_408, partial [Gaiellaceae bacterium]|nr:hypothetical protein [Gaiellaceae bacterium]
GTQRFSMVTTQARDVTFEDRAAAEAPRERRHAASSK